MFNYNHGRMFEKGILMDSLESIKLSVLKVSKSNEILRSRPETYTQLAASLESVIPGVSEEVDGAKDSLEKAQEIIKATVKEQLDTLNTVLDSFTEIQATYKQADKELVNIAKVKAELKIPLKENNIPAYHEMNESIRTQILSNVRAVLNLDDLPPINKVSEFIEKYNANATKLALFNIISNHEIDIDAGLVDENNSENPGILTNKLALNTLESQVSSIKNFTEAYASIDSVEDLNIALSNQLSRMQSSHSRMGLSDTQLEENPIVYAFSVLERCSTNIASTDLKPVLQKHVDLIENLSGKDLLILSGKLTEVLKLISETVTNLTQGCVKALEVSETNHRLYNVLSKADNLVTDIAEGIRTIALTPSTESVENSNAIDPTDFHRVVQEYNRRIDEMSDVKSGIHFDVIAFFEWMKSNKSNIEKTTKNLVNMHQELGLLVGRKEKLVEWLVAMDKDEFLSKLKQLPAFNQNKELPISYKQLLEFEPENRDPYDIRGPKEIKMVEYEQSLKDVSKAIEMYADEILEYHALFGEFRQEYRNLFSEYGAYVNGTMTELRNTLEEKLINSVPAYDLYKYNSAVYSIIPSKPLHMVDGVYSFIELTLSNHLEVIIRAITLMAKELQGAEHV